MQEKQKQISVPEWIEKAIQEEASKHHRAWMREALAMLEAVLRERGYGEVDPRSFSRRT